MEINVIPCLKDNYAYLVEDILIDAPDFATIDRYLKNSDLKINFILSTHHHWDHVDGNLELKNKYHCKIYGSKEDRERIPGIDKALCAGEIFQIRDLIIEALFMPGHTSHHIVYYIKQIGALFSGDTLFSMGCGRLVEGSYEEMFNSLQKIKALPEETLIYCGHEYSEKNAQFALSVEPDNTAIQKRYKDVLALRSKLLPTVPTSLALEKQINPFLRASSVDEFAKLRQLRDNF